METGENLRLIEPVPVDDDLITGVMIEEVEGVGARFICYARQTCWEAGATVYVVRRKIVMPTAAIRPAVQATLRFLAAAEADGKRLRLVT